MITEKQKDLCYYRMNQSEETIKGAILCYENHLFKDAINRSYYVATELIPKDIGRLLSKLQKKRETSDYDDFYVASSDEAKEQIESAKRIMDAVKNYILNQKVLK